MPGDYRRPIRRAAAEPVIKESLPPTEQDLCTRGKDFSLEKFRARLEMLSAQ